MSQHSQPTEQPYSFSEPKDPSLLPSDPKIKEGVKNILSTIAILILAPLLAIIITAFLFQSYVVDGKSMQNTLHNRDRLIIVKAGKTWANLTRQPYIPDRGTIVVFSNPGDSTNKQLIKRVIGLPGDEVVVKDGRVTIYNAEHPDGFDPDSGAEWSKTASNERTAGNLRTIVGKGELFVMGDNRGDSLDSRIFGPIDNTRLAGTLLFRFYPLSKASFL